uniref:Putative ovule protein n=1 Tax=Solanum chacoense TaxID=4108 RepID=A0A0V0GUV4_SOLCH
MIPGSHPKRVSKTQIQNSTWQLNLRKTPRGGKMMARRMSMHVIVLSPIFSSSDDDNQRNAN